MSIDAKTVKDLRDRTGAGMMDCKKALAEVGGDLDKAVALLREKGLASASKKAGRVAAEGLIGVLLAFRKLSSQSELDAVHSSGIGMSRFIRSAWGAMRPM